MKPFLLGTAFDEEVMSDKRDMLIDETLWYCFLIIFLLISGIKRLYLTDNDTALEAILPWFYDH